MKRPSLLRLSDAVLLREFEARLAKNNSDTAELIAYIAEIDRRQLYRPAGYSSMYKYCVGHFHLSEAAAYKRIYAARLIRRFPAVHDALAEGRVHLSGLIQLMACLRRDNVEELLAAATHKSRRQIEKMLAERFPKADVPATIREVGAAPTVSVPEGTELSPGKVEEPTQLLNANELPLGAAAPTPAEDPVIPALTSGSQPQALAQAPVDRDRVKPLSAKTYCVQFTMDEASHELLRQAQDLLGHRVAPGDLAGVFSRALRAYVALLQRRKFAATDRPHRKSRPTRRDSRHIPAHVRYAVWERDGGQCTYESESGHRCEERRDLEFDHIVEFARGGKATVDGIRLRCRPHNQYQAERTYGAAFMQRKREQAAERAMRPGGADRDSPAPAPGPGHSSAQMHEAPLPPGTVTGAGVTDGSALGAGS